MLLGAGDAHGGATVEWTLDNLGARFHATRDGLPYPARAFADRLAFEPGPAGGTLPAFRFPFPEQRTVARTLAVPDVNSWLALEPAAASYLTALIARSGARRLLRSPGLRRLAVRTLSAGAFGPERAGAVVFAHDAGPDRAPSPAFGHRRQTERDDRAGCCNRRPHPPPRPARARRPSHRAAALQREPDRPTPGRRVDLHRAPAAGSAFRW